MLGHKGFLTACVRFNIYSYMRGSRKFCQRGPNFDNVFFLVFFFFFFFFLMRGKR